jgi:hypothetical protein
MNTDLKRLDDLENELQGQIAVMQKNLAAVRQTKALLQSSAQTEGKPAQSVSAEIELPKASSGAVSQAIKEIIPAIPARFTVPTMVKLLAKRGHSFPRSSVRACLLRMTDLVEIATAGKAGRATIFRRIGG